MKKRGSALKYFIIDYHYLVPFEKVAENVADHRAHLDEGYAKGWFLASGPQNPKTGGLLIARAPERSDLDAFFARDPFVTRKIAEPRVIEFEPVKRHPEFAAFFAE